MLIDTHCHLDFPELVHQIPDLVREAKSVGVTKMLTIGCDLASSRNAVQIAQRFSETIFAAVGVHPNEAAKATKEDATHIRAMATDRQVVAIGEIGLDFYRDRTPRDLQMTWFERQWNWAQELELPVIIHCRDAMQETLRTLTDWTQTIPAKRKAEGTVGIMHCFSGTAEDAAACLDLGLHIGIGGPVTYPKSEALREAVLAIPLSRLLVETDAPFLAPQPRRGKTNQPAYARLTAQYIADLKGVSLDELASMTTHNAERLFPPLRGARS